MFIRRLICLFVTVPLVTAKHIERFAIYNKAHVPPSSRTTEQHNDLSLGDEDLLFSRDQPVPHMEQVTRFSIQCLDCALDDPRIPSSIRDAFAQHHEALEQFSLRMSQGNHLFLNGRNNSPEDMTRLTLKVNSDADGKDTE